MYRPISKVPNQVLKNIRRKSRINRIICRDVVEEDFKKWNCNNAEKPFTMKTLISELDKIKRLPNYTLLPDQDGKIRIVFYGRSPSEEELEGMKKVLNNAFGRVIIG